MITLVVRRTIRATPERLFDAYTWQLEPPVGPAERVIVTLEAHGPDTCVVVTHQRITDAKLRQQHEQGWLGCLEGLAGYLESGS